jgi:hypothetical protein
MAAAWAPEEWEAKRRLVCFQRTQSGSTINASFKPVSADDRSPNSICISCIYWEEKEECFVTSTDTIYLLEQLVAARFTVEEKNRIRRNLEGFRPLTASKGKQESEEFFKVIMAFPNPKPRNIEKDLKVFHWKDLSSALKKIIWKYVSSFMSLVNILLTVSSLPVRLQHYHQHKLCSHPFPQMAMLQRNPREYLMPATTMQYLLDRYLAQQPLRCTAAFLLELSPLTILNP